MTTMAATGFVGGERLLYGCIAASIVVHALAMLYAPKVEPAPPPAPRISATLRAAAAAPAPAPEPAPVAVPEPPKPEPVVEKAPPPPPTPAAKPAMTPKVADKAITKSAAPAQETAPAAPPPPSAPPVAAAPPQPAAAAPAEPSKAAAAPGPSADASEKSLIDGYQNNLAQVASKYKRYPNEAMQNNWEGTATVRLKIGADGKIAGVEITNSSGHPILDEQASITINKAKPFVQIPPGLKGKEFVAVVRIVFSLKT